MSPVFSADIIARVKDETDIVEIVRQQVSLKPAGSVMKGLCPFHKEKSPSFIVTPARQTYHCFGCGVGGDVISFVMETEGLSFPEAVEVLARPLDIDLSAWLREDEGEGERRAFHRANETAMDAWREALWDPNLGRKALEYLKERGFTEKVLRDFDVGYAPPSSHWLTEQLHKGGVDEELALRSGLVRRSDRDGGTFAYFRDRIIFPIKNISRQVAGFGGRVIDRGEPKYLNSSDSSYYTKGKLLYGFDVSRMPIAREKSAILVEGYLDLLALAQVGIANVVATCGTAFTPEQARLVRRGAPNVILVFDGDKAGLKAAVRSSDIALKTGLEPTVARLPQGEDPASLVVGVGVEAMRQVLKDALGYVPLLKALADEKGAGREVLERALRQALSTTAGIDDPLRREYVLQEAATVFGVAPELLRDTLSREQAANKRYVRPKAQAQAHSDQDAGPGPGQPPPLTDADSDFDPRHGGSDENQRSGLRVRFKPARAQVRKIEASVFAAVLGDESGKAAKAFLAERGDLPLRSAGAEQLAAELDLWAETTAGGSGISPREFVTDRWNSNGDGEYRGFVSGLLGKEETLGTTDQSQVVTDCLKRLQQDYQSRSR